MDSSIAGFRKWFPVNSTDQQDIQRYMPLTFRALAQISSIVILTICCFLQSFAQTNVPAGNVSGTWSKAQSPYIVNGDLTIPDNQKLIIEPGVEIRFSGNFRLIVTDALTQRVLQLTQAGLQ